MKRNWLAALALAVAAAGIIAYKESARVRSVAYADAPKQAPTKTSKATVLLFADLGEAAAACGCGQIIRLVRAAAARGVPTQELPPGDKSGPMFERFKVMVTPTVLVLDQSGATAARFEGESKSTIESLRAQLDKMK